VSKPMYKPPSFAGQSDEIHAAIENEHRRMLRALESIHKISGDMLDEKRRAGPSGRPLSELRRKGLVETDVAGEGKSALEMQGVQEK